MGRADMYQEPGVRDKSHAHLKTDAREIYARLPEAVYSEACSTLRAITKDGDSIEYVLWSKGYL